MLNSNLVPTAKLVNVCKQASDFTNFFDYKLTNRCEMIDLKGFRKANKLSQKDVAEEIGVSRSFIGQVESGFSKLPDDKLNKLITNTQGWDVSCLTVVEKEVVAGDNIHQNGGSGNIGKIAGDAGELMALRKENEMLREQLAKAEALADKYWGMIEKMTEK